MSDSDGLAALRSRLRTFVAERDWAQFHDAKNLAMAIASEAGELLAELRWVASKDADQHVRNDATRLQIEHEVADIAIALILFCERAQIDLIEAVAAKIDLNEQRYPVPNAKGKPDRPIG